MKEFEHFFSDRCSYGSTAVCLHCTYEWREDDWYPADGATTEVECPRCMKPLQLYASHSIRIYTCPEKKLEVPTP